MTDRARCHKDSLGLLGSMSNLRLWALDTPHTLAQVIEPGYFGKAQGIRTGDWVLGNVAAADGETFEPVILVCTLGYDNAPGGTPVEAEVVVLARPKMSAPRRVAA